MHLTDLCFRGLLTHPERLALSGDGGDFSYRQAWRQVCRIARRLHEAGFGPGDRFAVLSPNSGPAMLAEAAHLRDDAPARGGWHRGPARLCGMGGLACGEHIGTRRERHLGDDVIESGGVA